MNDLFLVLPDADNSAWESPGDLASDRGRFTLTISFDTAEILSDENFYAELAGSLALTVLKQSVLVRSAEITDNMEESNG